MKQLPLIALAPLLLLPASALASSPAAWKEFDTAVQRSCLAKSDLLHKKVTGQRVDFSDDVGYSALIISGKRIDNGKSQTVKSLCLYNRQKQTASLADMP